LHDNSQRGLARDLTQSLGSTSVPNSATEMTKDSKKNRYMRNNPEIREGIMALESRLRQQPLAMIPKDRVRDIENRLQNGDILGIVSRIGNGYGTSQVGLAYRGQDGLLQFMHASPPGDYEKAIVDLRLSDYLDKYSHSGIVVGRPLR